MVKMETEPESSPEIEQFILGWKNSKMQLPNIFHEMLQQKEFIDVTLSADGRSFGANRLILSAYSPYFRQLFAQIPIEQKAYVILANVSASILEDLITFIYLGEVNVRRENLGELLKTGQLLNIKGLANANYSPESKSKSNKNSQLNSRSFIKNDEPMMVQTAPDAVNQEPEQIASSSKDFAEKSSDKGLKPNVHEVNNNYICAAMDTTISVEGAQMPAGLDKKHWQCKRPMTVIHDPEVVNDSKPAKKLLKLTNDSPSTYTSMADIRTNTFGRENLFHNGFKFYQQVACLKKTRWICMKHSNKRCKAAIP